MSEYILVENGDLDDAENVNVITGHPNLSDYVVGQGELNPHNIGGGTFDLTAGKWFVLLDTETTSRTSETRHYSMLTGHIDERTGISLVDSTVDNHVYMDPHIGTDDSPLVQVETDSSLSNDSTIPADEWLHIATIHSDGTATLLNRAPDGVFDTLDANDVTFTNGDFTTVTVDKVVFSDNTEQSTAGIVIGDTIDNPNDYYDANPSDTTGAPPGTVYAAVYADKADEITAGGIVPGDTLTGTINIQNDRYETTDQTGTAVDKANQASNSASFQQRDAQSYLYEHALKAPQTIVPRSKVRSGTPTGSLIEQNAQTFKLWSYRVSVPNNETVGDLAFRIRAGDGTILYGPVQGVGEGDHLNKTALFSDNSRSRIHLELYHTNGTQTRASCVAGYTIE